ncbi:hypothetical protein BH11PLA2_BH11PLA2_32210 [soil metagenome]
MFQSKTGPFEAGSPPSGTVRQEVNSTGQPIRIEAFQRMPVGYAFVRELGRGGMGVVLLAQQERLKRDVAIKRLLVGEASAHALERFRTEAEAVARLRHSHVVQVYEYGEDAVGPYCVLEYMPGGSLATRLAKGALAPVEAAQLVAQSARGVHAAHLAGILHRDLKPDNILIDADGSPKVSDFGLAKLLDTASGQTQSGDIMGTPSYMAPEQARGDLASISVRTDVWALGGILYATMTGRPPFQSESLIETLRQVQTLDPNLPTQYNPSCPPELQTIAFKCLEKDPARRYATAADVADDLDRWRNGEPILARPASLGRRARRWAWRMRMPLAAAVTAAIIAVSIAIFWTGRQDSLAAVRVNAARNAVDAFRGEPSEAEGVEAIVAAVDDPAAAAAMYETINVRLAEQARRLLGAERLTPEAESMVGAVIDALENRNAGLATEVKQSLSVRRRQWQTSFRLNPDGSGYDDRLFGADKLLFNDGTWQKTGQYVLRQTHIPNGPFARLQIDIVDLTEANQSIGLRLDGEFYKDKDSWYRGYRFVLRSDPKQQKFVPFAAGTTVQLAILRDKELLDWKLIVLPPLPWQITAERDARQLTLRLNDLPPLIVFDPIPLSGERQGCFGFMVDEGLKFTHLHAETRPMALQPSAVEHADKLWEAGRIAEARELYRSRLEDAEALFKAGLCAERLKDFADAQAQWRLSAALPGNTFPPLASARLLIQLLDAKKDAEADALLRQMATRFQPGVLAGMLKETERTRITGQSLVFGGHAFGLSHDTIRAIESTDIAAGLTNASPFERATTRIGFIRALHLDGQCERALQLARESHSDPLFANTERYEFIKELAWLQRTQGSAMYAIRLFDEQLPIVKGKSVMLVIEKVRTLMTLQQWPEAFAVLDAIRRDIVDGKTTLWYNTYAEMQLIEGFRRFDAGEVDEAKTAWKAVNAQAWLKLIGSVKFEGAGESVSPSGFSGQVYTLIAASLANNLNDTQAQSMVESILKSLRNDGGVSKLGLLFRLDPAVLQRTFQTKRGIEIARHVAFRDRSAQYITREPFYFIAAEQIRAQTGIDDSEAAMDVILDIVRQIVELKFQNKLSMFDLVSFGPIWAGLNSDAAWKAFTGKVPAPLRLRMAWLLGYRFRKLGQPEAASRYFQQAAADASLKALIPMP